MQVNSIGGQNFGCLNTKKCEMFVKELKNNEVLQNAAKKYNITAFETKTVNSKNDYVYNLVLEVQEKAKGLINKLSKKGAKGSVTIESYGSIRPSKIQKAIDGLKMSDIENSVAKQQNIVKNVETGSVDKIMRDADLDFRYNRKFGEFPQDSLKNVEKQYYHTASFSPENLDREALQKAMNTEIELKYMAEWGLI